jgi:hypothetical protein
MKGAKIAIATIPIVKVKVVATILPIVKVEVAATTPTTQVEVA